MKRSYPLQLSDPQQRGCGFLCFRPRWLQGFVHVPHFVGVVSFYTVTFVMSQLYLMAVITTLEKRFGFSSSASGMLISIREIAYLCSVIVASHFARNTHKPKYLAALGYLAVAGGFVSVLPYIIYKHWQEDGATSAQLDSMTSSRDLCLPEDVDHQVLSGNGSSSSSVQTCAAGLQGSFNRVAYALFALTCVVFGLTYSSVSPLTITYVDDAASEKNKGLYLGIMNAMKPFGPLLAFLLGGVFTNIPEDLFWSDVTSGGARTQWVGAWWLGYVTCPLLLLLSSTLLAFFPRHLPPEPADGKDDVTVAHADIDVIEEVPEEKRIHPKHSRKLVEEKTDVRPNRFQEFVLSLSRLVRHPIYMMLLGGACFSAFIIAGMLPFIPKYLEVQFRLSAAMANIMTGVLGAMMAGIGILLGGVAVSRMRLSMGQCALFVLLTDVGFIVTILSMGAVGCQQTALVDPTTRFAELSIRSNCTPHCACSNTLFLPVCGSDMRTYVSPCHAGCSVVHNNQSYSSCGCIGNGGTAVSGSCEPECAAVIPYMALCACAALVGMMAGVPALTILLRTVQEEDRSLALGLSGTVVGLTSFVPGPILFGGLIDSTCLLWHTSCGESGACVLYNNDQFRIRFHVATAGTKVIAGCFYVAMWLVLRKHSHLNTNIGDSQTKVYKGPRVVKEDRQGDKYVFDKETSM